MRGVEMSKWVDLEAVCMLPRCFEIHGYNMENQHLAIDQKRTGSAMPDPLAY